MHITGCLAVFALFLGWFGLTRRYQEPLKIRDGLLVGTFLAGLVTLGTLQQFWLQPAITALSPGQLFWGALALTAVTDNAALTYLGTLVSGLDDAMKYALVSGSVVGGGLTIIANAPNPVAYGLLFSLFPGENIRASRLLLGALVPTAIAALFVSLSS